MRRAGTTQRGVHPAGWTVEGCPVFYAVTSRGQKIAEIPCPDTVECAELIAFMEGILDDVDPVRGAARSAKPKAPKSPLSLVR